MAYGGVVVVNGAIPARQNENHWKVLSKKSIIGFTPHIRIQRAVHTLLFRLGLTGHNACSYGADTEDKSQLFRMMKTTLAHIVHLYIQFNI